MEQNIQHLSSTTVAICRRLWSATRVLVTKRLKLILLKSRSVHHGFALVLFVKSGDIIRRGTSNKFLASNLSLTSKN